MNWLAKLLRTIMGGAAVLFLDCKHASRLQSDALDRNLDPLQRLGLRFHLLMCKWCRRYGTQIGFLRGAARKCGEDEDHLPPQALSPEARERIRQRLQAGE